MTRDDFSAIPKQQHFLKRLLRAALGRRRGPGLYLRKVYYWLAPRLGRYLPWHWRKHNILFLCNSPIMAPYLHQIWELLQHDSRLGFVVSLPQHEEWQGSIDYIRDMFPIRALKKRWVYAFRWDLIILADHTSGKLLDGQRCPSLRIMHGTPGKRLNGEVYAFGQRAYDKMGRIRYARMFVSNHSDRALGISIDSAYENILAVVGNLEHDKLLAAQQEREQYRQQLGLHSQKTAISILSTWGPHSLLRTIGEPLINAAQQMPKHMTFMVCAHPHEFRQQAHGQRAWGSYLHSLKAKGFIVRDPTDDWFPYVLASDIVITDHTALCLDAALLQRPVIFVPTPEDIIESSGLIAQLRAMAPVLAPDASNLAELLGQIPAHYPYEQLARVARAICPYPGQASERMRAEIYDLLNLKPYTQVS